MAPKKLPGTPYPGQSTGWECGPLSCVHSLDDLTHHVGVIERYSSVTDYLAGLMALAGYDQDNATPLMAAFDGMQMKLHVRIMMHMKMDLIICILISS